LEIVILALITQNGFTIVVATIPENKETMEIYPLYCENSPSKILKNSYLTSFEACFYF